MFYNINQLYNLMLSESQQKNELMPSGKLTKHYKKMCYSVAFLICSIHNKWQFNATINNVIVNGGSCAPSGPLSSGIGIMQSGNISGKIVFSSSMISSQIPNEYFPKLTANTKNFISSILTAFKDQYNNMLSSTVITNISVNKGSCSCKIVSGTPVPGSYSDGDGKLSQLNGNFSGTINKKIKSATNNNLTSLMKANGRIASATLSSITAISNAIEKYNQTWLQNTKINGLKVSGGVSIPNAPIISAIGNNGKFI